MTAPSPEPTSIRSAASGTKGGLPTFAAVCTNDRVAGLTGLMQMRHDPSLWRRRRYMLRAAVQRNFPKADVHVGLNTSDRNQSFAADAPQVRVADKTA